MKTSKEPSDTLEDAAAAWAVRHAAGLTPDAQAEFELWLASDPRHYAAFAEADLALTVLNPPREPRDREELRQELAEWERSRQIRRTRRRLLAFSSVGLAAAAVLVLIFAPAGWLRRSAPTPLAVMTAHPLVQKLPDGSAVELNDSADIAVEFTPAIRGVRFVRGEAHFAVAKDAARPFIVSVGPVKVWAVGTEFNIRFKPEAVEVLVTDGTVRVIDESAAANALQATPAAAPRETNLVAGQRTVIPLAPKAPQAPVVAAVSPDDIQRELAWRQMRFELSNATLEQAVALFNQKGHTQLAIGDSDLRDRRVSGIYWADNPEQFAELIESSLDVKAVREGSDRIVFRKR